MSDHLSNPVRQEGEAVKARAAAGDLIGMVHPLLSKPAKVPFGTLKVCPERFQVRNPKAAAYVRGVLKEQESRELSASLVRVVEAGGDLDPPIYWEDPQGTRWVIDGHHRMEAWTEAGKGPRARVIAQRFNGASEAEARDFALTVNRRDHLNMDHSEALDAYWRALLCGEVFGSVRGRARHYCVSVSTVQRMDKEKALVLAELQQLADGAGSALDVLFIRENAPAWKDRAAWREGSEQSAGDDGGDRRAVEGMLRTLAQRFTEQAKAQPYVLAEAFEEFLTEITGREVEVRFAPGRGDEGATGDF